MKPIEFTADLIAIILIGGAKGLLDEHEFGNRGVEEKARYSNEIGELLDDFMAKFLLRCDGYLITSERYCFRGAVLHFQFMRRLPRTSLRDCCFYFYDYVNGLDLSDPPPPREEEPWSCEHSPFGQLYSFN